FLAVGATAAARPQLVAGLDLVERTFLRIGKFHRIRSIAQETGFLGGFYRNAVSRSDSHGNHSTGGIDGGDNPASAALLPVFTFMLLLLRHVRLLHHHN